MPKFTEVELALFVEHTCSRCHEPNEAQKRVLGTGEGCPILKRARRGQMSSAWKRRRNGALGNTFECRMFTPTPPSARRGRAADETESMFDTTPYCTDPVPLVPVDGWPDYRAEARKQREGDHQ